MFEGAGFGLRYFSILEEIMLGNKGFDLWADGYDRSVDMSDEDEFYIVAEVIAKEMKGVQFEKISHCAGILNLEAI